jgi:hypothetical protein
VLRVVRSMQDQRWRTDIAQTIVDVTEFHVSGRLNLLVAHPRMNSLHINCAPIQVRILLREPLRSTGARPSNEPA